MALSSYEQQDLKALLIVFFPTDQQVIESNTPNEETLEQTEKFLFEVNKCSRSVQTLLDAIGGGRLTLGGLRQRTLRAIADAARKKDKSLQGVLACTNTGRATYRRPIMDSFTI